MLYPVKKKYESLPSPICNYALYIPNRSTASIVFRDTIKILGDSDCRILTGFFQALQSPTPALSSSLDYTGTTPNKSARCTVGGGGGTNPCGKECSVLQWLHSSIHSRGATGAEMSPKKPHAQALLTPPLKIYCVVIHTVWVLVALYHAVKMHGVSHHITYISAWLSPLKSILALCSLYRTWAQCWSDNNTVRTATCAVSWNSPSHPPLEAPKRPRRRPEKRHVLGEQGHWKWKTRFELRFIVWGEIKITGILQHLEKETCLLRAPSFIISSLAFA